MFYVKTVPALKRARADIHFKRLVLNRAVRCTATSSSTAQTEHDGVRSRGGSECPGLSGRGGRRREGTAAAAAANEISVDFEQTREAYKSKDSLELLRSLVVFKLCSYDFLVDKNKEVMRRYLTAQPGNLTRSLFVNVPLGVQITF